jgi:hypothetical protein
MEDPPMAAPASPNGAATVKKPKPGKKSRPPVFKTKFTPDEDAKLQQVVEEFGHHDWALVSFLHGTRNPRQCRERYQNYLSPTLRADPWTSEEDALLVEKCAQYGTKWNKISEFFTNRSDNSLRNRWQMLERRDTRQRRNVGSPRPRVPGNSVPPPPRPPGLSSVPMNPSPIGPQSPIPEADRTQTDPEQSLKNRLELAEKVDSECNIFRQDEPDIWSTMSKF